MSTNGKKWLFTAVLAALALTPWGYYLYRMGCSPLELSRLLLGLTLLWGPCGILLYQALSSTVEDRICRFTFAWAMSYTLTTLCYFALAALNLTVLFYLLLATALCGAALIARRRRQAACPPTASQPIRRWDGWLIFLIGASLVINLRYQDAFSITRASDEPQFSCCLFPDQLYFVGQAYALDHHFPPKESMIRAGTPERAYHNFPHLTTKHIARFTFLGDMLRVHLFYHYGVIEVLFCLTLFSLASTITGTRWPGYVAICLMYLLPIPPRPLLGSTGPFYFTLFPHVSSGLLPVCFTSPQMYSGLLVLHCVLLGLVLLCKSRAEGRPTCLLVFVLAVATGATLRFRVHVFLVLAPVFAAFLAVLWLRTRQRHFAVCMVIPFLVGALSLWEMRRSAYLPDTTSITFGYNGLTDWTQGMAFLNSWPFADRVYNAIQQPTSSATCRKWIWQCLSMTMFSLTNIIGIPLLVGTVYCLSSLPIRRLYAPVIFGSIAMTLLSIILAIVITTPYDNYSVGGQLVLHTRWYLYFLGPVAIWLVYRFLRDRARWPAGLAAASLTIAALVAVFAVTPLSIRWFVRMPPPGVFTLSEDEWLAVHYIHDHTPAEAVVLTNRFLDNQIALSGLTGRASYLDYTPNPIDQWLCRLDPADNRQQRITDLWTTSDLLLFRERLGQTGATVLLEYADRPLLVHRPPSLVRLWSSPRGRVTVWGVNAAVATADAGTPR